jgi:H+-translocating NAD(P) transhydrogenase subunit alpha
MHHLLARGRVPRACICGLQDADYEAAGASVVGKRDAFHSDIVLKVQPPSADKEVKLFKKGGRLVSYINPAVNSDLVEKLKMQEMTVIGASAAASA